MGVHGEFSPSHTMGQIKLGRDNKETVGSVAELLPTINPEFRERRLDNPRNRSSSSIASTLLVILSFIFAVSALKQICDLREQNLSLMQQLAYERQKDAALKLAVRDNIPENRFMQHRFNSEEAEKVEAEGIVEEPRSTWSINLSVLWTSPTITPCDMSRLARVLAEEIYQVQEENGKKWNEETQEELGNDESGLSWSGENEKSKNLFEDSIESEEDLSEESEEKSSEESKEHATKEDLLSLIQSKDDDSALDTLDYFLRNSDIWDDSEEYDLLGTDSAEQDYYNYYY